MLFDTHAHYDDERFESELDKPLDDFITELFSGDVGGIINAGTNIETCKKSIQLSEKFDRVYASVGIHPSDCYKYGDIDGILESIRELSRHKKVVAIGEIGLDYHYDGYDKDEQKRVFIAQLKMANEVGLPVIIHSRDACFDTVSILKENKNLLSNGFLMHCYSESVETAKELLKLGGYFAFGGAITFKNAKKQDVIKSIPIDRLFAETDRPYLTPVPHRGEKNEPKNVVYVYNYMADVLDVTVQKLKAEFNKNSATLFKKFN